MSLVSLVSLIVSSTYSSQHWPLTQYYCLLFSALLPITNPRRLIKHFLKTFEQCKEQNGGDGEFRLVPLRGGQPTYSTMYGTERQFKNLENPGNE